MNTRLSVLLASVLLGSTPAFAVLPGSTAALTFSFTASYTAPGIKLTDPDTKEVYYVAENTTEKRNRAAEVIEVTEETKTVTGTFRYGNAQLINDLIEEGMIDGPAGGWSIISVGLAYTEESQEFGRPAFYAVKKNKAPVFIDIPIETLASAATSATKKVENYVTGFRSFTGSGTEKSFDIVYFSGFRLSGLASDVTKLTFGSIGKGANAVAFAIYLTSSYKMAALAGRFGEDGVAEGTFSIAPAKVIDLTTLGFGDTAQTAATGVSYGVSYVDVELAAVSPEK